MFRSVGYKLFFLNLISQHRL